jgi:hypothetical protein
VHTRHVDPRELIYLRVIVSSSEVDIQSSMFEEGKDPIRVFQPSAIADFARLGGLAGIVGPVMDQR